MRTPADLQLRLGRGKPDALRLSAAVLPHDVRGASRYPHFTETDSIATDCSLATDVAIWAVAGGRQNCSDRQGGRAWVLQAHDSRSACPRTPGLFFGDPGPHDGSELSGLSSSSARQPTDVQQLQD